MIDFVHLKSAQDYFDNRKKTVFRLWLGGYCVSLALSLTVLADRATLVVLAALPLVGLLPLLRPRYGLYLLFLATLLIEQVNPPGGPRLLSAQIPFFGNINTFTSLPLSATPAEIFLGLIVVGYVIQRSRKREGFRLRSNPLLLPVALFALTLAAGTAHGLADGGDFKAALWEIRAPFYLLLLVLIVPGLIENRQHVTALIWIIITGGLLKAIEGLWVTAFDLHWATRQVDTIVGHDDAIFLAADLVLLCAMLFIGGDRWQRWSLVLGAPLLLYVLFATNRRAAFVALGIGLLILVVVRSKERPNLGARLAAVLIVLVALYGILLAFSEGNSTLAQPLRALTSAYSPSSDRDEASNLYRANERIGLWATIKEHPAIGIGFGKPYYVPPEVFDIGFPLYEYIPHNDILRMWAKGGTVGFVLHWLFFGAAITQGMIIYRRLRSERLKALVIFGVCFTAMQVTVQYVDMLMTFYRNMIFLGISIGLFLTFERLDDIEASR